MDKLSDYDYYLPEALIAQTPLEDRAASRLLHLERHSGLVHHRQFRDAIDLLAPGDLLVMNDTRVSALRLYGQKPTGGQVEALLLDETLPGEFIALVRPAKRLHPGAVIEFANELKAIVQEEFPDGQRRLVFEPIEDLPTRLRAIGTVPLPPYIQEALQDPERYQTVIASKPGSAAAPTAGLHFTPEIIDDLRAKNVNMATVTLHVGIDTFRPVGVEDLSQHTMHGEVCEIPEATAEAIARATGRIIAVGTTSVRTLESFATGPREVKPGSMVSKLFIREGFRYQVIDGMFTNFHMPKTTMLLMISALSRRDHVLEAYRQAVESRYRFLSFGDSMLIL